MTKDRERSAGSEETRKHRLSSFRNISSVPGEASSARILFLRGAVQLASTSRAGLELWRSRCETSDSAGCGRHLSSFTRETS